MGKCGSRLQSEMPETGIDRTFATEDDDTVEKNPNGSRVKSDLAPSVTKLHHGKQGRSCKGRDNMDVASRQRKLGNVELRLMCRIHDRTIGIGDSNWVGGEALVDDVRRNSAKVCCAATVSDSKRWGRVKRGGTYM